MMHTMLCCLPLVRSVCSTWHMKARACQMGFANRGAPRVPVPWAWQVMEQTLIAFELHSTTVCNSSLRLKDQEGL